MADENSKPNPEADLFQGASERAQQLFRESKRVRRLTERKLWWQANGNKPKPTNPNEQDQGD